MKWLFSSVFGIIGVILLLVGCPFMAVAGGFYYFVDYRTSDWPTVEGTVTGMQLSSSTDTDGNSSDSYCPYVEFTTADGEAVETLSAECANPPAYETGDAIELKYNPTNPQETQLKGGVMQTLSTIFFWVFGGLGALLAFGGIVLGIIGVIIVLRRG